MLEGDNPLACVDLAVHVASACGGGLLVRREVSEAAQKHATVDALEAVLLQPDGMQKLMGRILGDAATQVMLRHPEILEQQRRRAPADLDRLRREPAPQPTLHWTIAEEHRGIERAQLVVVNVHGQAERASAEALLAEVARLRTDRTVFDDVRGNGVSRVPITAVVADLTDPRDPGTRKALARVRRALASAAD